MILASPNAIVLDPVTQGFNNLRDMITTAVVKLQYNWRSQIIALVVLNLLSVIGNIVVIRNITCTWRKKRKRVRRLDWLFVHLAAADLCVALLTLLSQIICEGLGNVWLAEDLACKMVNVIQIFGLVASSNIIVLALARQLVITKPFTLPLSTEKRWVAAWICALLLSRSNLFENLPRWHFQLSIIFGAMVVFILPFNALYQRKSRSIRLNVINSGLPRAEAKVVKMSPVTILLFIACGLPYFVLEMKIAFGNIAELDQTVIAVLGVFVVSNSVVNPFVYLNFHPKNRYLYPANPPPPHTHRPPTG
uniref:G-protein coupled receptors family 1 profile domain-containing protein n=1 Tax=Callorhinchus milii TaxID=7868 RepID=A0A4W3JZ91_CALMI